MSARIVGYIFLGIATFPFIYYLIALYSTWRFFRRRLEPNRDFTPPISNLKPVKGVDPEAYENFASFCRQDYPDYELIFCVGEKDDPVVPILTKLIADFPQRRIRIIYSSGHNAVNDKVAKLGRLVAEAQHEVLVFNDADVRVRPDYLRTVVAPLRDSRVGGVTCLYVPIHEHTFIQRLQSMGMVSDFFPGTFVARELDGVKFALGQTIVTTRARIEGFGGYQVLENRPADDLLVGRFITEQGYEVELLPYAVETVDDFDSPKELFYKRLRWMTVMRHMRPWGHLGMVFTQGLAWSLVALAIRPTVSVAAAYFGTYLVLRTMMTWITGVWGLKQTGVWKRLPLFVIWDATVFAIWVLSFGRKSIRWRGIDYKIQSGILVPLSSRPIAT